MIKRLDLDDRDDRLTLDVFKSMFGLRTIQLGRKAYCWRLTSSDSCITTASRHSSFEDYGMRQQVPQMVRTRSVRHEFTNVSPVTDDQFRQDPEELRRKIIVNALSWVSQQTNASKRELIEVLSDSALKQATKAGLSESDIEAQAALCRRTVPKKHAAWRAKIIEFCRDHPDMTSRQAAAELTRRGVPCSSETCIRAKRAATTGVWSR